MAAKALSQNRSKTVLSKGDHFQARSDRNLGFRAHVGIKTATECRVDQPAAGRGAAGGKPAVDGEATSADFRVQYHQWETQAGVQAKQVLQQDGHTEAETCLPDVRPNDHGLQTRAGRIVSDGYGM